MQSNAGCLKCDSPQLIRNGCYWRRFAQPLWTLTISVAPLMELLMTIGGSDVKHWGAVGHIRIDIRLQSPLRLVAAFQVLYEKVSPCLLCPKHDSTTREKRFILQSRVSFAPKVIAEGHSFPLISCSTACALKKVRAPSSFLFGAMQAIFRTPPSSC